MSDEHRREILLHEMYDRDDHGAKQPGPKWWTIRAALSWDRREPGLYARLSIACDTSDVSHHAVIERKAVASLDEAGRWAEARMVEIMTDINARLDAALAVVQR